MCQKRGCSFSDISRNSAGEPVGKKIDAGRGGYRCFWRRTAARGPQPRGWTMNSPDHVWALCPIPDGRGTAGIIKMYATPSCIFIRNVGLAAVISCVSFFCVPFFAYPGVHARVGRQRDDYSASHSLSWQESHPHVVTLVDFAQRRISGG